jgi:hypothetical protein
MTPPAREWRKGYPIKRGLRSDEAAGEMPFRSAVARKKAPAGAFFRHASFSDCGLGGPGSAGASAGPAFGPPF